MDTIHGDVPAGPSREPIFLGGQFFLTSPHLAVAKLAIHVRFVMLPEEKIRNFPNGLFNTDNEK